MENTKRGKMISLQDVFLGFRKFWFFTPEILRSIFLIDSKIHFVFSQNRTYVIQLQVVLQYTYKISSR